MKILITGGSGFIGANLIDYLFKNIDCNIVILDKFPSNKDKVTFIQGNIINQKDCHTAIAGVDCIIHLAAQTNVISSTHFPIEDARTNILGTLNLLELCVVHKVKKFIFASSNAVFGNTTSLPYNETTPTNPISPYGISKLTGEMYCRIYSNLRNISTICFRFSNVYGPQSEHKSSVIVKFIKRIKHKEPLEIYGTGKQTRDFIHVDDISSVVLAGIHHPHSDTFCLGTGTQTSIMELVNLLKKFKDFDVVYKEKNAEEIEHSYCSIDKAKKILKWSPKINLEKGLDKLITSQV